MDFPIRKYERGSNWSEPEVVQLLQFWSDETVQNELESCLRNQHVFNRIADALHSRGIYRTADQCREKIKKLKLDYRRMKESQKTPRGGRARKFYDVMDRVLSSRPVAPASSSSSSAYSTLWGNSSMQQTLPGNSSSSLTFSSPPKPGDLLEIKLEELNADGEEELLSAEEPLCSEEDEAEVETDCKIAGGDTEELGESLRGEGGQGAAHTGWSPLGTSKHTGFSDNVAGCSCPGASPAAVPSLIIERSTQADLEDPKPSSTLRQRKRRRPIQAGSSGRLLEKALASFISWQKVMEERYISLEETRLQREAQAEIQRMQQEERRVQQDKEHELRIISLLTGAFTAAQRTVEQERSNTTTSVMSAAVSESVSLTEPPRFSSQPSTFSSLPHTRHIDEENASTKAFDTRTATSEFASLTFPSHKPTLPSEPQMLQEDEILAQGSSGTSASEFNTRVSESATLPVPLCSPSPGQQPSSLTETLPFPLSMLRGNQTPQHSNFLSRRGNRIRQHLGILQEGFTQYHANKHDETRNVDGIINMGTSENKLCFDLLQKRLTEPDMLIMEPSLLQYPDWKGHDFLREEVAKFLSEHCHSPRPLRAENMVVMNGCGSILSAVAAVLCDPDDSILIPAPFYGVITEDVDLYSSVKLYCVPLDSEPNQNDERPFHLTAEKLEHAFQKAKKEGVNLRALILVNPHNPLGSIYTAEEMTSFLEFAKTHELHAIVDEIYMLSVFDGSFNSVLSLQRLPDPQRTHVIWGVSKDFAMAGVRVGTVYTENVVLVQALEQLGCFHGVSGLTQHQVAQLLMDKDWMNKVFLPENRRRLQEAHHFVSAQLLRFGVPYLHRGAGFFIWANFSKYLKENTFEEELRVWRCFLKHRVLLSCGQAFSCSSPGWFRIVFSDQQHRLQLGLKRIEETLQELQDCSILPDYENINIDKQQNDTQSPRTPNTENKNDSCKDTTIKAFNTTEVHSDQNGAVPSSLSLADENFEVSNSQPFTNSNSLDSLIGALRQHIHTSDWLEKNKPKLAAGEDPTQVDVFKDLLDRARI